MTDFNSARQNMIKSQLMANNITQENILEAIEFVPREKFLPLKLASKSYLDEDVKTSPGRYLIEPRILGKILNISNINIDHNVLDLACGNGYTSAILAKLSNKVCAVDNKRKLLAEARRNIENLNISNINFVFSNPNTCKKIKNKFDIIFIFGGVQIISERILDLLNDNGGRLITVLYNFNNTGKIGVITKINGKISQRKYSDAQTPIINDFRNNKKQFIL